MGEPLHPLGFDALHARIRELEGMLASANRINRADLERIRELEGALRECARLSGADLSDGFPDWPPLHEYAVQEVRRLREDYDEACDSAALEADRPETTCKGCGGQGCDLCDWTGHVPADRPAGEDEGPQEGDYERLETWEGI